MSIAHQFGHDQVLGITHMGLNENTAVLLATAKQCVSQSKPQSIDAFRWTAIDGRTQIFSENVL